jgi:hypothetical protein
VITDERSPGTRLLAAIRAVLERTARAQVASAELAVAVNESDLSLGGEPIAARELAARLREFEVCPRLLRHGNDVFRGYRRSDFDDAFRRYLPGVSSGQSVERCNNRDAASVGGSSPTARDVPNGTSVWAYNHASRRTLHSLWRTDGSQETEPESATR